MRLKKKLEDAKNTAEYLHQQLDILKRFLFEGMTPFRNVNHEGVYTVLVMVAH